jgi:hypothetical protein
MNVIGSLVEVGIALVAAGWLLKQRSEEAALDAEPIPVPVRSRR